MASHGREESWKHNGWWLMLKNIMADELMTDAMSILPYWKWLGHKECSDQK